MSKRLCVVLPDLEIREIRRLARREGVPVDEWARRALRAARAQKPANDPDAKLKALRKAAEYSFPTADIEQMLDEIDRGYQK